ncbi:MAG: hypothetical protein AAGA23_09570 [Pseudomonadota bacterium]
MGRLIWIFLLASASATGAAPSMKDVYERHTRQIDGATQPDLILLSEKVDRLYRLAPMTGLPQGLQFSFADSLSLAWFAHDRCENLEADLSVYQTLFDEAQTAADAGAAFDALQAKQEEALQTRWDNLLSELTPEGRQALIQHLEEVVTPEIVATRIDLAAIWTELPELYEQTRRERDQPAEPAPPQPTMVTVSNQPGPAVASSGTATLVGMGGPLADECLRQFVTWLEPALLIKLADRYQLDVSPAAVEAYIRQVMPEALDFEQREADMDITRLMLDASEAVLDGRDPVEVFHAFALDDLYQSLDQWLQIANRRNREQVEGLRAALDAQTPEKMRFDLLNAAWTRQGSLEEQYVAALFPDGCGNAPAQGRVRNRSPLVASCQGPAQEAYLAFVEQQVSDGPAGWLNPLRFLSN